MVQLFNDYIWSIIIYANDYIFNINAASSLANTSPFYQPIVSHYAWSNTL